MTVRSICTALRMSPVTVQAIKKSANPVEYRIKKAGRRPVITPEMHQFIDANLSLDSQITDAEMAKMIRDRFHADVSVTTICRCRNALRFVYRPPLVCQDLTSDQVALRLEFCRWVLEHEEILKNLIFSDESRFEKTPDNGWRRIRRGCHNETCFVKKTKFPAGVMVWGAIGPDFRTDLIRCSKGVTGAEYVRIIEESRMIPTLNAKFGEGKWIYVQDGATSHTCRLTSDYLASQKVAVMPGWPPNSPDLNPIEMVWGIMKRRSQQQLYEANEMFDVLQETWKSVADETINKLVASFLTRCQLVMRLGGASAARYLSSPSLPLPQLALPPRIWSLEEDERLLELYNEVGARWKFIGQQLDKSAVAVKHHLQQLKQIALNETLFTGGRLPSIHELVANLTLIQWKWWTQISSKSAPGRLS